ncbi:MAG: hypothetical protein VYC39_18135 [Myxococcota bacterium]|nr:hypothetical protein [Myxococcota bacterium]
MSGTQNMGAELAILGMLAALAIAYWQKSRREHQKQCPKCGAYVHEDADICKYCDYKF